MDSIEPLDTTLVFYYGTFRVNPLKHSAEIYNLLPFQGIIRFVVADEFAVGGCATVWGLYYDAYWCPVDWGQHWLQPDATETTVDDLHRRRAHQFPTGMVLLACAGCRLNID